MTYWNKRYEDELVEDMLTPKSPPEFHYDMTQYPSKAIVASGMTKNEVAKRLSCDSRLVMKWTRAGDPAWCLPTPRFYRPLKELLKLDDEFDVLLSRESPNIGNGRDDFEYKHDTYIVDDKNGEMLHPSQKPLNVVEHIVSCLS